MQPSLISWLNANPAATGPSGNGSAVTDDRFTQILQQQRRNQPGATTSPPSSGSSSSSDSRQSQASHRQNTSHTDNGGTPAARTDGTRNTAGPSGNQAGPAKPNAAPSAGTRSADRAEANPGAPGEAHPFVAEIHSLTAESRWLASTLIALRQDPRALPLASDHLPIADEVLAELPSDPITVPAPLPAWPGGPETDSQAAQAQVAAAATAQITLAPLPTEPQVAPAGGQPLSALSASPASHMAIPAAVTAAGLASPETGTVWQAPGGSTLPLATALPAQSAETADLSRTGAFEPIAGTTPPGGATTTAPALAKSDTPLPAVFNEREAPVSAAAPAPNASPITATPVASALVAAPLGAPHWGNAFSQQVVRISTDLGNGLRHAELRLDPPDLGPVRISLSLSGEQATAMFFSPHAAVRLAIEQALPQLQQALAEAGIQLGQTSVGEQQNPATEDQRRGNGHGAGQLGDGSDADAGEPITIAARAPRGLVDTFA